MEDIYKVVSYNLGNGASSCEGKQEDTQFIKDKSYSIFNRKKTISTTLQQSRLLIDMNADFLLIQELTGLTPMNAFVNTKDIFLKEFKDYSYKYFPNLFQFNGLLEHGKANLVKNKYDCEFINHEISKDEDDYSNIKTRKISYLKKLQLYANAFILNNRSMIETSVKLDNEILRIFNIHLIPYDMNQEKRIKELEKILTYLMEEYRNNSYIVIGGDFNFNLKPLGSISDFPKYFCDLLTRYGWKLLISDSPTHRRLVKNQNGAYSLNNLDGFIVSPNIDVINMESKNNYELCDHSPILLEMKLK